MKFIIYSLSIVVLLRNAQADETEDEDSKRDEKELNEMLKSIKVANENYAILQERVETNETYRDKLINLLKNIPNGDVVYSRVFGTSLFVDIHDDPEVPAGAAHAAAWLEDGYEQTPNQSITGEVHIIQNAPTENIVQLVGWVDKCRANSSYILSVHLWEGADLYSPCDLTVPEFVAQDRKAPMRLLLESNQTGQIEFNATTDLIRLWKNSSVVGRMMLISRVESNATLLNASTMNLNDGTACGCGIVGVANDFTVVKFLDKNEPSKTKLIASLSAIGIIIFTIIFCRSDKR